MGNVLKLNSQKIKVVLSLIVAVLMIGQVSFASAVSGYANDFRFNGCSGGPDGTWGHCCYEHDLLYWAGGDYTDRKKADDRLEMCVNKSGGPGYVFYDFVRAAGAQYWARAWQYNNVRSPLTEYDIERIKQERELWASLNYPSRYDFIVTESILLMPLTTNQKVLLKKKFESIQRTSSYRDFYKSYIQITNTEPLLSNKFKD